MASRKTPLPEQSEQGFVFGAVSPAVTYAALFRVRLMASHERSGVGAVDRSARFRYNPNSVCRGPVPVAGGNPYHVPQDRCGHSLALQFF